MSGLWQASGLSKVDSSASVGAELDRNPRSSEVESRAPARRMAPLAIQMKDCVLQYPLGAYVRGSLKSLAMSVFGHRERVPPTQYVSALRGINIEIQQGERVALIGHNGSGKSTLLRAMAGIYPLASGAIRVSGKLGTLLELGMGFEQEATGRENIYYRGMAMGYSRRTLAKYEKEIVEFCGLGDFIDLPVRTYSSGMYVRLTFAISTQFSPEVLLVDEVFGAGDATFAQKAVARMQEIVSRSGIFVIATHDLNLVQRVCSRAIWLDAGRVVADGPVDTVIPDFKSRMAG